jgi:hypothetical protein
VISSSNCDSASRDTADRGRNGGAGVGGNNYRENWKARQEAQNTLVFNFINSKKDVSHIENDGLDLTKRTTPTTTSAVKKVPVRYGTVRYGTVRNGTVRYGTVRYGTVRYGTAHASLSHGP